MWWITRTKGASLVLAFVAAAAGQSFDAASIKPADPASPEMSWQSSPGMLRIKGMTLRDLIQSAYGVNADQVTGGPKWVTSDRFDVVARMPADQPAPSESQKRFQPELRQLLADRCRVKLHEETRTVAGYSLVEAKSGLRLKPVGNPVGGGGSGPGMMMMKGGTMENIASMLATLLHMPVVDRTGLSGAYDFRIEFTPLNVTDPSVSDKPSLFTALQESLGLKLESEKVPWKFLVLDRAEKPDEN